jgi:hypothetical protein
VEPFIYQRKENKGRMHTLYKVIQGLITWRVFSPVSRAEISARPKDKFLSQAIKTQQAIT